MTYHYFTTKKKKKSRENILFSNYYI